MLCRSNQAEVRTCRYAAVWAGELSVVPDIEELRAECERRFSEKRKVLVNTHIPVVDTGTSQAVKARRAEGSTCALVCPGFKWQHSTDKIHRVTRRIDIARPLLLCLANRLGF